MNGDRIARQALVYGLGAAVGIAWLVSVFADIFVADYTTPYAVHGLMGIVVGAILGDGNFLSLRKKIADKLVPSDGEIANETMNRG